MSGRLRYKSVAAGLDGASSRRPPIDPTSLEDEEASGIPTGRNDSMHLPRHVDLAAAAIPQVAAPETAASTARLRGGPR